MFKYQPKILRRATDILQLYANEICFNFSDVSENIFSYGSEVNLGSEIMQFIEKRIYNILEQFIICFVYRDLNYPELMLNGVFFV